MSTEINKLANFTYHCNANQLLFICLEYLAVIQSVSHREQLITLLEILRQKKLLCPVSMSLCVIIRALLNRLVP